MLAGDTTSTFGSLWLPFVLLLYLSLKVYSEMIQNFGRRCISESLAQRRLEQCDGQLLGFPASGWVLVATGRIPQERKELFTATGQPRVLPAKWELLHRFISLI